MKILTAVVVIGTFTGFVVAFKQNLHSLAEPQDDKFLRDYIDTKIELEISKSVAKIISKVDDTAKELSRKVEDTAKASTGDMIELSKEMKKLGEKVDNLDLEFQAWKKAFTFFARVCSIIVVANIHTFLKNLFSIK